MATLFTDFSGYSNGQLGTVGSADWTVTEGNATWTQTVDVAAKTLVVSNNGQGGAVTRCVLKNLSTSGDVEVYARLKIGVNSPETSASIGPGLIDSSGNSYVLILDSATTVRLGKYNSGSGGNGAWIDTAKSYTITADTYFKIRLGRSGTTIRAKIWDDGASEPGTWNAGSGTNTTLTTVYPGLWFFEYGIMDVTTSAIGAGTGADSAPTSASSPSVVPQVARFYRMLGVND